MAETQEMSTETSRWANSTLSHGELQYVLSLTVSEVDNFLDAINNPSVVESILRQLEMHRTGEEILREARHDPAAMRRHTTIVAGPEDRNYDTALDNWQREQLEVMDPAWAYMARVAGAEKPGKRRFYLERPRGHSKTTDIAAYACWSILSSPSMLWGYACAASEEQAKLITKSARVLASKNPWMGQRLIITDKAIRNPITGSLCQIVASNDKTTFGETPNFVICDELTHWSETSGEEVWETMFSGIAKVPDSLLVIISNAGHGKGRSWQWKLREKIRIDPAWEFRSLDGVQASWLSEEDLEEQQRVLGDNEYRRLYLNKWLSDTSAGIPSAFIENSTRLAGPTRGRHAYDDILAALDIGLTNDRTSLVLVGIRYDERPKGSRSPGKVELVNHFTWKPRDFPTGIVDLAEVEARIEAEHVNLGGISALYCDDWEATRSLSILRSRGIPCEKVQFGSAEVNKRMGKDFFDAFRDPWFELYYDKALEDDIRDIEVQYKDRSRAYHLHAERTVNGHADSAFALAIAIMKARQWIEDYHSAPPGADETYLESAML